MCKFPWEKIFCPTRICFIFFVVEISKNFPRKLESSQSTRTCGKFVFSFFLLDKFKIRLKCRVSFVLDVIHSISWYITSLLSLIFICSWLIYAASQQAIFQTKKEKKNVSDEKQNLHKASLAILGDSGVVFLFSKGHLRNGWHFHKDFGSYLK